MAKISLIIFSILFTCVLSNNNDDVVRIVNSGSTNTAGYVVEVQRDGRVTWNVAARFHPIMISSTTSVPSGTTTENSIQLSVARVNNFYQTVEQALPFSQYKPAFCMKSVSFGTRLYVTYNGEQTPDLSCPLKDQQLVVLSKFAQELIAELHINTMG